MSDQATLIVFRKRLFALESDARLYGDACCGLNKSLAPIDISLVPLIPLAREGT